MSLVWVECPQNISQVGKVSAECLPSIVWHASWSTCQPSIVRHISQYSVNMATNSVCRYSTYRCIKYTSVYTKQALYCAICESVQLCFSCIIQLKMTEMGDKLKFYFKQIQNLSQLWDNLAVLQLFKQVLLTKLCTSKLTLNIQWQLQTHELEIP